MKTIYFLAVRIDQHHAEIFQFEDEASLCNFIIDIYEINSFADMALSYIEVSNG
jgi:hypothetical protein